MPLFIKKHNDEGTEFYFMGDVTPLENSFIESSIPDDKGGRVSVVKVHFHMNQPVEDMLYLYLTSKSEDDDVTISSIESAKEEIYPFRVLSNKHVKPFVNCIPLFNIEAAAGKFSDLQINSVVEWIELSGPFKYSKDYFVCKAVGESMNKRIPNNSWCLFKKDDGGTRVGKIVLVNQRDIQDPDYAAGYTIKMYDSEKELTDDRLYHKSIILKPLSTDPNYKNIVLTDDQSAIFKVEGIFVKVLN